MNEEKEKTTNIFLLPSIVLQTNLGQGTDLHLSRVLLICHRHLLQDQARVQIPLHRQEVIAVGQLVQVFWIF